jgi:hypothetical protein
MSFNRHQLPIVIVAILVIAAVAFFAMRDNGSKANGDANAPKTGFKFQRPDRNRQGRKTIVTDRRFQRRLTNYVRLLPKASAMDKQELDRLLGLLKSGREDDNLTAMIDAQKLQSEALVDFVKATLESPDKDIREQGVAMLAGVTNPSILSAVKIAAKDPDPAIRVAALDALNYVGVTYAGSVGGGGSGSSDSSKTDNGGEGGKAADNSDNGNANNNPPADNGGNGDNGDNNAEGEQNQGGEESHTYEMVEGDDEVDPTDFSTLTANDISTILGILRDAFNDSDIDVRSAALQAILQLDIDIQTQAFEIAQQSSYTDVRGTVLFMTATSANSDTLAIAFNALDDPDEVVRGSAVDNIRMFIDKEFKSSAEAFSWWNANSHRYDDTLFLYNPEEADEPQIVK